MSDLINRQQAIDAFKHYPVWCTEVIKNLPSVQPKQHEIGYFECANAMLKMWIDDVLTDGEYNRIMDKLNAHWAERSKKHVNVNT